MQRVQYGEEVVGPAADGRSEVEMKRLVMGTLGEVKWPTAGEMYGN